MRYKKRAQVTVFMILGIVVLIGMSIYFYSASIKTGQIESVEQEIQEVPIQLKPISLFVESCMKQLSIGAFRKVGEHGGYIEPNNPQYTDLRIELDKKPYQSEALLLDGRANPVPYWWYLATPNDCIECNMNSLRPSFEDIESQVNKYVDLHLKSCIDGFKSFDNKGFVITAGELKTETSINDQDVTVTIDYPLTITSEGKESFLTKFRVNLDLNFYEIYTLAQYIMTLEREGQFLEEILLHLISVYSATPSETTLPPIGWMDYSSSKVEWSMDFVDKMIREEILASHIPLIQLENTKGARRIGDKKSKGDEGYGGDSISSRKDNAGSDEDSLASKIKKGVYNVLFIKSPIDLKHLNVNFLYNPKWQIHLDITPNTGGKMLKPKVVTTKFPFNIAPTYTTNYYEFYYDVAFPVLVVLHNENALMKNNEPGYTFMFALEANIRDNKNLLQWNQGEGTIGPSPESDITLDIKIPQQSAVPCKQYGTGADTYFVCPVTKKNYRGNMGNITCQSKCIMENKTSETIDPSKTKKMFCNDNQKISGNVRVNVKDKKSRQLLEDVTVTHGCGTYASCGGYSTDNKGIIETKFPVCVGSGHLTFEKEEYKTVILPNITTVPKKDQYLEVELERYISKNITVKYIDMDELRESGRVRKRNLKEQHTATFFIKPTLPRETLPVTTVNLKKDEEQTIKILPGKYEISILLRDTKGLNLPGPKIPGQTISKPIKMKQAIVGEIGFDEETGYWEVKEEDIGQDNKIEFYVLHIGEVTDLANLSKLGDADNITMTFRKKLNPKFQAIVPVFT